MKQTGEVHLRNVVDYYEGLRILGYAHAKAGNYPIQSKTGPGKVTYAPLDVNLDYADMALRTAFLMDLPPPARLAWLEQIDNTTRGTAMGYMRQGWPQGEALVLACKEHQVEWKMGTSKVAQQMLAEVTGAGKGKGKKNNKEEKGDGTGKVRKNGKFEKVKRDTKGKGTGKQWKGKDICKRFNDRGCSTGPNEPCPFDRMHVCDVILPNKKVCGGAHTRADHK